MGKFWENYKQNLNSLVDFSKASWKAFAVYCLIGNFIIYAANFILSFYVIDAKYHFGGDHFIPDWATAILSTILVFTLFYWHLNKKNDTDSIAFFFPYLKKKNQDSRSDTQD